MMVTEKHTDDLLTDTRTTHVYNYFKKTMTELKNICREHKIKGFSSKNKQDLVKLIEENIVIDPADVLSDNFKSMKIADLAWKSQCDRYTEQILRKQYQLHKEYIQGRISSTIKIGITVRLPSIPEDISENIIKEIIRNKLGDKTTTWDCKTGDLYSKTEGKQECKCFTSNGPLSFTPTSDWNVLYFLDARNWLEDVFILYRIPLSKSSDVWKSVKINKSQTFQDQADQGRRPRINWEALVKQIESYCVKIYEGTFDDIFIPVEEDE